MHKIIILLMLAISLFGCKAQIIEMVKVSDGTFTRGIKDGINNPLQELYIDSFEMSKYEISVGLFRQFLRETNIESELLVDQKMLGLFNLEDGFQIPLDWPIFQVSFYDALEFCNWLSIRQGYEPVYNITYENGIGIDAKQNKVKNGYRLPTEAEWEYAASGQGNIDSINEMLINIEEYAWINLNSERQIHSIGLKKANYLGLYDILGNVAEWCWDLYDVNYYKNSDLNNHDGPLKGYNPRPIYETDGPSYIDRVVRGGNIFSPNIDITSRNGVHPYLTRLVVIGFRVVRTL